MQENDVKVQFTLVSHTVCLLVIYLIPDLIIIHISPPLG